MDDLKITIDTLTPDQKREFLDFMKRQQRHNDRKDVALFQALQQIKKLKPAELQRKIYPEAENSMAYYALRKRLMRQLSDFILLKRMEEDSTSVSSVMGMVSLASYLFEARADRLAWNLLRKAEKLAQENEKFDLLNNIYNLQIEQADSGFADNLHQIIQKRNENKLAADEEERANIAASLIREQLTQVRAQGRDLHFDAIIQKVLSDFQLTEVAGRRPSIFYKLMTIARSAVLARKDFYQFEPYIIAQFQQLEEQSGFTKAQLHYKLNLLYMIAHVLYRNRKFSQSNAYLEQIYAELKTNTKSLMLQFYPRYVFLKTANLAFLEQLEEASELMQELIEKQGNLLSIRDQLTAQFGLSFLYFAQENYKKANLILMRLPHSDKFCETKMGKEWVLKKNMGELILQLELQNPELAMNKVRIMERSFKTLLAQEAYHNVRGYLQLLKKLIEDPYLLEQPYFVELIEKELEFLPPEQEDIQSISFYAWLKAKILKRRYYDVLLELAAGKIPERPVKLPE
ncbi:hypothetical protein I5M27_15255 [Adhaeribacter sp. BT258]|uniref:Uncharacterized protein n=1 Tax=Adhaeribacter terrigena TaxID=2793070 RepID=A0ABS1C4S1_9BACT|nr:hypothetical protein [Adhaeribacter terrigena]MBK0404354.1 hypothetical protein [Adhaeribacter terrigena]